MSSPPTDQARREAEVVSEHLPTGYGATFHHGSSSNENVASSSAAPADATEEESSLTLQGGDIHRDLFKAAARTTMHRRANTFHHPVLDSERDEDLLPVRDQLAPGGFRRAYLQQQRGQDFLAARMPITRNFVEFLDLYGNFAGEDLADTDDDATTSDEEEEDGDQRQGRTQAATESRPLLGRRKSTRAVRSATSGTAKTFFTLLKAFIGTGIMFLPKAFNNGGILFSSMTMLAVSAVSMVSFHLLLACKKQYSGGYGELGQAIVGDWGRSVILVSITLSQLGFVCAGIVFVAENIMSFLQAVTHGHSPLSSASLIVIQMLLLIPLSFIRNISKLGPAAIGADVFIMIGLVYIYWYDISHLATDGMDRSVVLFNPEKYTLTIGAAIFTFEGIGLILPIQSSMEKPQRFEWLLGAIMFIITVIFTSVGALCYATFGDNTYIEVINNFPQSSKFVNAVQFLYSLAVLIGNPVQLFPALRIIEGKIFGRRSGKKSTRTKWTKNALRTALVVICGGVSIIGASNLDRFVALIGSFACVPLVYIYPPFLHYKGVATTWQSKAGDIVLMALGVVCMVYTTVITVINSFLH